MVIVVPEGTPGELVGCDNELFAHELLLELHELVIADRGPNPFAHALQRCVVGHREGVIDLELLGSYDLYLPVTLARVLQSAVLVLEVELLAAEDGLEMLYHCSLSRVRCSPQPH
jgi:hypothetical protein